MGPGHLLGREQELAKRERKRTLPCVCFVYGGGEDPRDRATTRLGGAPYWPVELAWPTNESGDPLEFVGQLDFRMVEWFEPLSGDLLTIHIDWDTEADIGGPETGGLKLTWHESGSSNRLIEASDVPQCVEQERPIGPFHAAPTIVLDALPNDAEDLEDHKLCTIHGTKIGGFAPFAGDNWRADELEQIRDPVFLCSVGCVAGGQEPCNEQVWLPSIDPRQTENFGEVRFFGQSVLTVLYPKGSPDLLYWIMYLP